MPVPGTLRKVAIDEAEISQLLEAKFGLEPSFTGAYLHLVKSDLTRERMARLLGMSTEDTTVLLEQMVSQGLIIKKPSAERAGEENYAALHPRMTMTNIFKMYEEGLVRTLRDRRATVDRVVNILTPIFEEKERTIRGTAKAASE